MIPPIIVALDYPQQAAALALVDRLPPESCRLKVGKELFTAAGPALVENLAKRGFEVFLDLKFHDIPHTVAGACRAAANLGVWMMNVHASGGRNMMQAAREALGGLAQRPRLVAVTVLTSMAEQDLEEVGIGAKPMEQVIRLAKLANACGLDGVVCSAREAAEVKSHCGADFWRITPGIRLPESPADDQKRVMTPMRAMEAGATHLVIGRPVTGAADPVAVLREIGKQISQSTGTT